MFQHAQITLSGEVDEGKKRQLSPEQSTDLLLTIGKRLVQRPAYYMRPEGIGLNDVKKALEANPDLMYSLAQMENSGGCPDIIAVDADAYVFADCSEESPDRRDFDYDVAAAMAKDFGVEMMTEEIYRQIFQENGQFDITTSSWLATPADYRSTGNGLYGLRGGPAIRVSPDPAQTHGSYRGWRGVLRVPKA